MMLVFGVKNRYVRMNVNYHKKKSKNIGTYFCSVDKRNPTQVSILCIKNNNWAYLLIWASNAKN